MDSLLNAGTHVPTVVTTESSVATIPANKAIAKPRAPKRKNTTTKPPFPKRFNSYKKEDPPTSMLMQLTHSYHMIFCSNIGCEPMARQTVQLWANSEHRIHVNVNQLTYVSCLAFLNRMFLVAGDHGLYVDAEIKMQLQHAISHVKLPDYIAEWIENIGTYTMASGATVIPWVAPIDDMFPEHCDAVIDPITLVVEDREEPRLILNHIITDYSLALAKLSRYTNFRTVNNTVLTGKGAMIVSTYPGSADTRVRPAANQQLTSTEARFGAACRYRDLSRRDFWPYRANEELSFEVATDQEVDYLSFIADRVSAKQNSHPSSFLQ